MTKDKEILKKLAEHYAEIAALPIQNQKRQLWTEHFSLKSTRPLVLATYGMWNHWCKEYFHDDNMQCEDPFYREHERALRMQIFQHEEVGDDFIQEPWITQRAVLNGGDNWEGLWGVNAGHHDSDADGGAWKYAPPIADWDDMKKLRMTHHIVDEKATDERVSKLHDAVGDIIIIDVDRTPVYTGFSSDISTNLAKLRGLETIMLDMYEYPDELHRLLSFMCDRILENNDEAEKAGDYSLTSGQNQAMPYCETLEAPLANSGVRQRKDIWGFCAAQEYTLISPEFHNEFLFQYQKKIYEHFAMVHYGCCEDLTKKIDMLRSLNNLRSIAVTPSADIEKCAEQIQQDYVISWRPNPTDMVSSTWDEERIKSIINHGLDVSKGCYMHITLKDVETVDGDVSRLKRWVQLVRTLTE